MCLVRRIILSLMLLVSVVAKAQYTDNFADGDFTHNPTWSGTTDKFSVTDNILKLNDQNASGSGSFKAYLSTSSVASVDASWECRVTAQVNLTSTNYVRFYLMSDTAELTASRLNGYFILVGGIQKEVALYRQSGSSTTKIIDGTDNRLSTTANNLIVKATRNADGNWQLFSKLHTESDFLLEGQTLDAQFMQSRHSGIMVNYSSSNKNKYSFDDFTVTGSEHIVITQNIQRHQVVMSEIMADPDPVVGTLPNAEYIELYNRTNKPIELSGWHIASGNTKATIQAGQIAPKGYIVLCSAAQKATFEAMGVAVAHLNSLPSLANNGALLVLTDEAGKTITFTHYSSDWYGTDNFRKDGGFSLERIDNDNLHSSSLNWRPSQNGNGGTPGAVNSVAASNPDQVTPKLLAVSLLGLGQSQLVFNKEMNDSIAKISSNYSSDNITIGNITPIDPKNDRITLSFLPTLSNDTVGIQINGLECVSGFALGQTVFRLAVPQEPQAGDVVINEILYNPDSGIEEYIELFNKSNKVINLAKIFVTTRNSSGLFDTKNAITTDSILLFPNQYLLLSKNIASVCDRYNCGTDGILLNTNMPTLPNSEGNIVICLANTDIIDEVRYSDKFQSPSVVSSKGVSLERISPYMPTNDANNWTSASFVEKYGTPARQNSQYSVANTDSEQNYILEYETFTPNNDGYRDQLILNYKLPESGYNITANIYTPTGVRAGTLANNLIAGTAGTIHWDGRGNNGSLCEVGIYVIRIEAIKAGRKINAQLVCVLGMR
ncbi:MAG: lamin tail domain-containing protein [Porphyromonadaceae bacterium]|nr:lamin tail domain-containing protein [Porphyromonadaceae bacterium]